MEPLPILLPDGKILLGGSNRSQGSQEQNIALIRYNTDGALDTTFGIDGIAENDFGLGCTGIGVQSNGKIVANGCVLNGNQCDFGVVRFNSTGSIDSTFGIGGYNSIDLEITDHVDALCIQSDDKILIAGESVETGIGSYGSIMRFEMDGKIDSTFSTDGAFEFDFGNDITVCFGYHPAR